MAMILLALEPLIQEVPSMLSLRSRGNSCRRNAVRRGVRASTSDKASLGVGAGMMVFLTLHNIDV
jgi:hypothetical protein